MKHNTLVEPSQSETNTRKKVINYSLLVIGILSIISIIVVLFILSSKSSEDFFSTINYQNSSFSIDTPILNSTDQFKLRLSLKDLKGLPIKDGPTNITLKIQFQYKDDLNLTNTTISQTFNNVIVENVTYYEAKLSRSIAAEYSVSAYNDQFIIGSVQKLTVLPSIPTNLELKNKTIIDYGKQNLQFTISDINLNDIILKNSLVQNKVQNKTKWDLSCESSNNVTLKSDCSNGNKTEDNIFNCDVEFTPKTIYDTPGFNCSVTKDNQKYFLIANNDLKFSYVIQNIVAEYDSNYEKIKADVKAGTSKYSLPANMFKLNLTSDEYECASISFNQTEYIKINNQTNSYEIKNPNNYNCSYFIITAENENGKVNDIVPAINDKGKINAEQKALNVLGNELGKDDTLHNLDVARRYSMNFFDYYAEPSKDLYGALYTSVRRIFESANVPQLLLHLSYTEVELKGKFTIMDSRFETSVLDITPMKLYKVDFHTRRSGKNTFYFTIHYKIVLSAQNVLDKDGKEYQFLTDINKISDFSKEAAFLKSDQYLKQNILVSKENLKLRTLLKLSYNKAMNSPNFEKTVKDKLKTFYESSGSDILSYLNYVIVNTWDRADSTLIFSNILSYEEGNLEGDMKLILPYSEVEDIKTLSGVLKVTANYVNYNNEISTKNELVIVDLFFRKEGLNPIYFDAPIKYSKLGSTDKTDVSYHTKLKESYPLVIKALKQILESIQ